MRVALSSGSLVILMIKARRLAVAQDQPLHRLVPGGRLNCRQSTDSRLSCLTRDPLYTLDIMLRTCAQRSMVGSCSTMKKWSRRKLGHNLLVHSALKRMFTFWNESRTRQVKW